MPETCPTCGSPVEVVTGGEGTSHYEQLPDRLAEAMERLYAWVGPGYPDLDDSEERQRFMSDVQKAAFAWASKAHATNQEGLS